MVNWNKTTVSETTTTKVSKNDSSVVTKEVTKTTTKYTVIPVARPGPHEDLFQHVNFEWLQTAVIPPEYSMWGSFAKLADESVKNQISLLKEIVAKEEANLSVDEVKLKTIWNASLKRFDEWSAGGGSYAPVEEGLATIEKFLSSGEDAKLAEYFVHSLKNGVESPLYVAGLPNIADSQNVVLYLCPSEGTLPSRDFYFDEKFQEKRDVFLRHLNNVVSLVGEDRLVPDFANAVFRFESLLANIRMKEDQARQFFHFFTVTDLDQLVPGINDLKSLDKKLENYPESEREVVVDDALKARIAAFLEAFYSGINLRETLANNYAKSYPEGTETPFKVIAIDGDYLRRIFSILFNADNRADLKAYLQYSLIRSVSKDCTAALDEEFFDFFSRQLQGKKEQQSSEKRTVEYINQSAGFLLGKVYVDRFFSIADKERVFNMIGEIASVMEGSIQRNDWLTANTKTAALAKLARFTSKIGFPDKWKSYDSLVFTGNESFSQVGQLVHMFRYQTEFLAKVNTVVDTTEWDMTPQEVNAYFNPTNNEIVFPAAIIQPPFYANSVDKIDFRLNEADVGLIGDDELVLDAANFGGIAAVIAHEITHGFDDQGRQFDQDGNVRDWWSEEDAGLFKGKCDVMGKQGWTFVEPATGKEHSMNPDLCMGENLADLGGISLGIQALARRIEKRFGDDAARRAALYRIFFSNWSTVWKAKLTDEAIVTRIATDPHAPAPFRGNVVKNLDQFYEAFDIKEGDAMYLAPQDRVVMW